MRLEEEEPSKTSTNRIKRHLSQNAAQSLPPIALILNLNTFHSILRKQWKSSLPVPLIELKGIRRIALFWQLQLTGSKMFRVSLKPLSFLRIARQLRFREHLGHNNSEGGLKHRIINREVGLKVQFVLLNSKWKMHQKRLFYLRKRLKQANLHSCRKSVLLHIFVQLQEKNKVKFSNNLLNLALKGSLFRWVNWLRNSRILQLNPCTICNEWGLKTEQDCSLKCPQQHKLKNKKRRRLRLGWTQLWRKNNQRSKVAFHSRNSDLCRK